ncbi:MAG TPA: hypothetical protein PLQ55_04055 [Bacilli bacterium]|nr:hypothetical protein [Bacilli bacterium]
MKASSVPKKKPTAQIIASSLGFLTIILLWIIISALHQNDIIFPGIISTLKVFFSLFQRGPTYFILLNTIGGLILVLVLSFLTALILSLISLKFPTFKSYITPFLALFKIIPVPALLIVFLVNFKQSFIPFLLTYIVLLPLVYDGLYGAFISINKDLIDELKITSKLNLLMIFKIYIPIVSKQVISTLLQALGLGLKVKVMSEFIAEAPNTIGYELSYGRATLSMDIVFAWSLILIVIVVILDAVLVNYLGKQEA